MREQRFWKRVKGAVTLMTMVTAGAIQPAHADDFTDLLELLKAKGSLTRTEYNGLLAKHMRHVREADAGAPRPRVAALRGRHGAVAGMASAPDVIALAQAQQAASSAARSAREARQAALSARSDVASDSVVRVLKYTPGKGVTVQAGEIGINVSGFVNGFYTFNSPDGGLPVAGGLSTGSSGFDSSSVRNGLLPAGLILKLTTHQEGLDLAAVFGMYPGINNADVGAFNANSGGSPVGLGTSGLDFRQVYMTVGNDRIGTFKAGRDLALFGSDAILDDATLLSVGSTGSNANPANTSLGRIGYGYVYADWIPQISYASPKMGGVQVSVGVMTPLDEVNYAGKGLSAVSDQHSSPMVQGKVTYDYAGHGLTGRIWASFLVQHQQHLTGAGIAADAKRSVMAEAGEVGAKLDYGPAEGVVYYYRASGLGTTGLFFDGVDAAGRKRDSEGYYVQGSYKVLPRLKLVGSYGVSNLYQAPGEDNAMLVRRNESEVGAAFYNLTDWISLVAEYAHSRSISHGPNRNGDNTVSGGAVLFF